VNDSIHVEIEIIDPRIIADGLPHAAAILDAVGAAAAAAGTAIGVGLVLLRHWFRFICTSLRCILHRLGVSLGEPFEERRHAHGGSRSERSGRERLGAAGSEKIAASVERRGKSVVCDVHRA